MHTYTPAGWLAPFRLALPAPPAMRYDGLGAKKCVLISFAVLDSARQTSNLKSLSH
jgi:hypothetical protein